MYVVADKKAMPPHDAVAATSLRAVGIPDTVAARLLLHVPAPVATPGGVHPTSERADGCLEQPGVVNAPQAAGTPIPE